MESGSFVNPQSVIGPVISFAKTATVSKGRPTPTAAQAAATIFDSSEHYPYKSLDA